VPLPQMARGMQVARPQAVEAWLRFRRTSWLVMAPKPVLEELFVPAQKAGAEKVPSKIVGAAQVPRPQTENVELSIAKSKPSAAPQTPLAELEEPQPPLPAGEAVSLPQRWPPSPISMQLPPPLTPPPPTPPTPPPPPPPVTPR